MRHWQLLMSMSKRCAEIPQMRWCRERLRCQDTHPCLAAAAAALQWRVCRTAGAARALTHVSPPRQQRCDGGRQAVQGGLLAVVAGRARRLLRLRRRLQRGRGQARARRLLGLQCALIGIRLMSLLCWLFDAAASPVMAPRQPAS